MAFPGIKTAHYEGLVLWDLPWLEANALPKRSWGSILSRGLMLLFLTFMVC